MKGLLSVLRYCLQITGVVAIVGSVAAFVLYPDFFGAAPGRIVQKAIEKKNQVLELSGVAAAQAGPVIQSSVVVDQLGYRPGDRKIGFAKGTHTGQIFRVIDTATNKPVLEDTINKVNDWDQNTGDITSEMDFSELQRPGVYRLQIPGVALTSEAFRIDRTVYNSAYIATTESFYYQRCGTEVNNNTVWHHPACHLKDGPFYLNRNAVKDVAGGWHDAGDHGKFVVPGAFSAAFLLYLYELQPQKFVDGQLNIPEAGNETPDLLDEARWELEWLLKMQGTNGAVYHKVQNKTWNGNYLPHLDPDTRYIMATSSTATANFAAVTALGARLYKEWDKQFAYQLYKASLSAWNYLLVNPDVFPPGGFRNPAGVEGGDYSDQRDLDERLWASAELYRLTGSAEYHEFFKSRYQESGGFYALLGWQMVDTFAFLAYLRTPERQVDQQIHANILGTLVQHSNDRVAYTNQNGYNYILQPNEFMWGSNAIGLGEALKLIEAFEFTGDASFRDAALDQLHYNLGRNTFNKAYVTGIGINPVRSPYHQFSNQLGAAQPVPGLAVGGPNRDGGLNGQTLSPFPARSYEDTLNYKVNEVAIYYSAPLTYVSGYFSDFDTAGS